jgi:hypothetical protein
MNVIHQRTIGVDFNDLRLDPIYDPFRKDPRFQKLIEAEKR